jgi:hypothetical protein
MGQPQVDAPVQLLVSSVQGASTVPSQKNPSGHDQAHDSEQGGDVVVVVGANVVPPVTQYHTTVSPSTPRTVGSAHPHVSEEHPASSMSVHGVISSASPIGKYQHCG